MSLWENPSTSTRKCRLARWLSGAQEARQTRGACSRHSSDAYKKLLNDLQEFIAVQNIWRNS